VVTRRWERQHLTKKGRLIFVLVFDFAVEFELQDSTRPDDASNTRPEDDTRQQDKTRPYEDREKEETKSEK
jgi:hypothetical protein